MLEEWTDNYTTETVKYYQKYFGFSLLSVSWAKRVSKFESSFDMFIVFELTVIISAWPRLSWLNWFAMSFSSTYVTVLFLYCDFNHAFMCTVWIPLLSRSYQICLFSILFLHFLGIKIVFCTHLYNLFVQCLCDRVCFCLYLFILPYLLPEMGNKDKYIFHPCIFQSCVFCLFIIGSLVFFIPAFLVDPLKYIYLWLRKHKFLCKCINCNYFVCNNRMFANKATDKYKCMYC